MTETTSAIGSRVTISRCLLVLLLSMAALTGCARHYAITLHNGQRVYTSSKPKLVHGYYVFKDGRGKETEFSQGDVIQIEPASDVSGQKLEFLPSSR